MTKKLLIYLTCFLATIAPIQAYAINLSKGQIIQMGKQGGALVKSGGGKFLKLSAVGIGVQAGTYATGAAITWCKNNQKKCKEIIGESAELVCEIVAGNEECNVSRKEEDGKCIFRYGPEKQTLSAFLQSRSTSRTDGVGTTREYSSSEDSSSQLQSYAEGFAKSRGYKAPNWVATHGYYNMNIKTTSKSGHVTNSKSQYYAQVWIKCSDLSDDEKRLSDDELKDLAKKIADNMDDEDIKNYYNYDYGDITINNNRYDGDDINNQTNIDKQCQNHSCNELSDDIQNDIKQGKYDIDDVNKDNCTMEENTGKYIACNITVKNDDEDNTTNTTNQGDTDKGKKDGDGDSEPHWCKTSDLTKEACEFFDWVDDEPEKPKNTKVDVEDEEEKPLDDDMINIMKSCPADIEFSVSMLGQSMEFEIDTMPFCLVAKGAKSYIISAGTLSAIFILAGVRRD